MMRRSPLRRGVSVRRQSRKRAALAAEYADFVCRIKDRDGWPMGWACRYCLTRRRPLDVHHIVKRSQGGALMDPANAVTLCRSCHDRTDAPFSKGRLCIERVRTSGGREFLVFEVRYAPNKWAARTMSPGPLIVGQNH